MKSVIFFILALLLSASVVADSESKLNLTDSEQLRLQELKTELKNMGVLLAPDCGGFEFEAFVNNKDKTDSELTHGILAACGKSCSSRDGNKDCFCEGGCWRTESDCGCD